MVLRQYRSHVESVGYVIAVIVSISCISFLYFRPMEQVRYANLHLIGVFLIYLFVLHDELVSLADPGKFELSSIYGTAVFAVGGFIGSIYVEIMYETLSYERYGAYTTPDLIAGVLVIAGVLAITRHAYGWIVMSIGIFALLFAYFGPYFPSLLNHAGLSLDRVISTGSVDFSGVYHRIFQIAATWVFIFIIWAAMVQEFGGLNAFVNIAIGAGDKFQSGVAQVAVFASMFMGSINGSTLANIAVTGSFTIPLMKERGLRSDLAGAIETVASTGGMILPPVMGSVAFLMVVFLPYTYGEIIVMAALPSLLFMTSVSVAVHYAVIKEDVPLEVDWNENADSIVEQQTDGAAADGGPAEVTDSPSDSEIRVDPSKGTFYYVRTLIPVLISLVVLVYLLVVPELPPGISGVYILGILTVLEFVNRLTRGQSITEVVPQLLRDISNGLKEAAFQIAPLSIVLSMMGLLISLFTISGVGFRLSFSVVQLAGGVTIVLLLLVMISSIVLGMGMPTPAAYVLVVTLIAPAMTEIGFADATAHFFVFYFAIISTMTPPIAVGAAVASRIAGGSFLSTALKSVRIGLPLFVLPYIFAFNEELIILSGLDTVIAFVCALAGLILLSWGINRRFNSIATYGKNSAICSIGLVIAFLGPVVAGTVL